MLFNRQRIVAYFVLLAAIALPRFLALDRFVTADEPKWLARSGNFYLALAKGDLENTFTREHPGVTVTWAGAAALLWRYPEYSRDVHEYLTDSNQIEPVLRGHGLEPLALLQTGRLLVALMVMAALLAAFWMSVSLVGWQPSLVGFMLIAFDPFHLGLSRLLHLDGLLSSLMLFSILAFLNYRSERKAIYLGLSGAAAGLAWLTKSPAFFLAPFLGLVALLDLARDWLSQRRVAIHAVWGWGRALIGWVLVGAAVFVLLWPAMWVNPVENLQQIFAEATTYAQAGHTTDVYFRGAVFSTNPGRVYNASEQQLYGPWANVRMVGDEGHVFYPLSFLWRSTPVVLLGLALAALGLVLRWSIREEEKLNWTTLIFFLFAGLFTVFITLGSKKFDRYLLPVFPPLDLVAGIGWVRAAQWLAARVKSSQMRSAVPYALVLVVAVQALGSLKTQPYYLNYYNPLMGGGEKAPLVMMIGWGEGLDQAARYLNARPGAEELRVMSWYPDGSFSYIFNGETVSAAAEWQQTRDLVFGSDYVVLYIHQWQRQLPFSEMLAYFQVRTPEHVIRINGIEYAQIYRMQGAARR